MRTTGIMHLIGSIILSFMAIGTAYARYENWVPTAVVAGICAGNIVFFTSLVRVTQGSIRIISLNPFRKGVKVNFNEIDKIFLRSPYRAQSYIIITTKGISTKYFLGLQNDMELVYKYISEQTDKVEYDCS